MLEITPGALEHIAVHGRGVTMTAELPAATHAQEVDPFTVGGVEEQRAEIDGVTLGYPQAFVLGQGGLDEVIESEWSLERAFVHG